MKFVLNHRKIIAAAMALTLFSVIMLQLAGCGGSAKTTAAATTTSQALGNQTTTITKTTATTAAKTTTTTATANAAVSSADGTVSVSAPSGWNLNDLSLYQGAVIGVANDANSEYLIVTKKAKTDVSANSTINDYMSLVKSVFGLVVTNGVWGLELQCDHRRLLRIKCPINRYQKFERRQHGVLH